MKRFVMVTTDKGGTGKSVMSRLIADRYARDDARALLIDCDGEVGQLYQCYCQLDENGDVCVQKPGIGVMTLRFTNSSDRERDKLLAMLDYDMPLVLADMPAGSLTALDQHDKESGFFDAVKTAGYRPTIINVLSPFRASTSTVRRMIELGGKDADYVVAVNRWYGDDEDFYLWYGINGDEEHPVSRGKGMLGEYGGIEIEVPKVSSGVLVAVDDKMLKFCDAAQEKSGLSRPQRSRLIRWMKDVDKQLDNIANLIGLDKK